MKIQSLDRMEEIVAKNKWLKWDGWTVINYRYDPMGWSKKNGAFYKGKWYTVSRYEPTGHGWEIPNKLVR